MSKVIAITGAASGTGLATSRKLAMQGHTLSLADLNEASLLSVTSNLQRTYPELKAISCAIDVRKAAEVDAWIDATISEFGRLDTAVNLAGVIPKTIGTKAHAMENMDEDD